MCQRPNGKWLRPSSTIEQPAVRSAPHDGHHEAPSDCRDAYLADADASVIGAFRLPRNWLNDILTFWLGSKLAMPERTEGMWLSQTDHMLSIALDEVTRLRDMVDQHGGPKNARFFGQ